MPPAVHRLKTSPITPPQFLAQTDGILSCSRGYGIMGDAGYLGQLFLGIYSSFVRILTKLGMHTTSRRDLILLRLPADNIFQLESQDAGRQ